MAAALSQASEEEALRAELWMAEQHLAVFERMKFPASTTSAASDKEAVMLRTRADVVALREKLTRLTGRS